MKTAIFLPVREGSDRLKNKNHRKFAMYDGGLTELKLKQLSNCEFIDEIILSSNDEMVVNIAKKFLPTFHNLRIIKRPDHLCKDETPLKKLIQYVPEITACERIIWTHVTSPFCDHQDYKAVFDLSSKFNSIMAVQEFQEYIWDSKLNKNINSSESIPWPRTQDLKKLYKINNAIFMAERSFFIDGNRIGKNPFLYKMDKIKSLDIDDIHDFNLAEAYYKYNFEIFN